MRELQLPRCAIRSYSNGTGDPLVFVHGVLTNANVWRKVIERVSPDFRCVALDLPLGAHLTPAPGADRTPPGVAEMIVQALDALELDRVTLVGNDTGGALCQMVAARHPDRLERLVLTSCEYRENCPPLVFRPMGPAARIPGGLLAYLLPGQLRPFQRLPVAYGWLAKRPIEPDVALTYVRPAIASGEIRADFAAFLRDYGPRHTIDAAERLGGFDRPALIAWSREDRLMPPSHGEELASALPNARLEWVEDSYTLSPEDRPDRVAEQIAAFAREIATVA